MKLAVIACAAAAVLLAGAAAEEPRNPADWVAQLGAQSLADRDAASASLLKLGAKARDAVRQALDSTDPEVKSRAQELWKTLRWLVVPDADEDIQKLVAQAEKGRIDESQWQDFVDKHGAESIRLVAEFRADGMKAETFQPALRGVLDDAPPLDVARIIARSDNSNERAVLEALLDEFPPADAQELTASHWMQIQIALWNYEKAFDFGRDFSLRLAGPGVVKQCAIAVDRGALLDKIHDAANKEIASETDPNRLCAKLSFYTGLFLDLDQKPLIDPLFDLAKNAATGRADNAPLRRLVESLLTAGMPERAVKALHNAQSPEALYMRSAADMEMQNEPAAAADWTDAMNALDAIDDAKKKEAYYGLAELVHEWHDDRATVIWQKILSISPADTVWDANSCFRMGEFMEQRHQFAQAADFYEKGVGIAAKTSGVMVATGPDGKNAGVGEDPVMEKIRYLRSRAAGQNTLFKNPPAAEGGNDAPR